MLGGQISGQLERTARAGKHNGAKHADCSQLCEFPPAPPHTTTYAVHGTQCIHKLCILQNIDN